MGTVLTRSVLFENRFMAENFAQKVYAVVRKIPKGKVMSYGAVAKKAGFPGAARAVGNVMSMPGENAPFHRVVCADGTIGGFGWGERQKVALLAREGVVYKDGRIVDKSQLIT